LKDARHSQSPRKGFICVVSWIFYADLRTTDKHPFVLV
jgi:hypothetical protein